MWSFTHDETKFTGSGLSELMCLWPCRSITTFVSETSNLKQLAIQPIIQYIMGKMPVVSCVLNRLLIHPYLVFPFFHFAIPCYIFITFYRMLNFFPRINWLYDHLDTLSDHVWSQQFYSKICAEFINLYIMQCRSWETARDECTMFLIKDYSCVFIHQLHHVKYKLHTRKVCTSMGYW